METFGNGAKSGFPPLGKSIPLSNTGAKAGMPQGNVAGNATPSQNKAAAPAAKGGIPMGDKADCPVCRGGGGGGNPLQKRR